MAVVTPGKHDLPVLLREDGDLQLMEEITEDTRWGRFVVWRGFITDLASVPFFLRGLVPNAGRRVNRAAILHDFACQHLKARLFMGQSLDENDPDGPTVGPRSADVMFREMLIHSGLPTMMAWIMWTGVRWGALGSEYRRPGWWRDFPLLVLVTVLTSWLTIPFGLAALFGVCLYVIVEAVVDPTARFFRRRKALRHDRARALTG